MSIQITERTPSEKRAYADGLLAAISMLHADFRRCMHQEAALIVRDMEASFQKMRYMAHLNEEVLASEARTPPAYAVDEEACARILADPVAVRELQRPDGIIVIEEGGPTPSAETLNKARVISEAVIANIPAGATFLGLGVDAVGGTYARAIVDGQERKFYASYRVKDGSE